MSTDLREDVALREEQIDKLKMTVSHVNSLLDQKAIREMEISTQRDSIEKKLAIATNEKIQMQFNFDVESDKLKEEILILQNKLQVRSINLLTAMYFVTTDSMATCDINEHTFTHNVIAPRRSYAAHDGASSSDESVHICESNTVTGA